MVSENIALISQDVFGSLKQEIDIKSLKKGLLVNHRLFRGDIINHTLFLVYEFLEEKYNINYDSNNFDKVYIENETNLFNYI